MDNLSLVPATPNFSSDKLNVDIQTGANVNFDLNAGSGNAGKDYCVWMNATGPYPGIQLNGIFIPLNWDYILQYSMFNGLPGTGLTGVLDGSGGSQAQIFLPAGVDPVLIGVPLSFAYVLTSPGPSLPISFASYPVHVKYIP